MQLQFSSYGLILGISIVIGISLIDWRISKIETVVFRDFISLIFYKVGAVTFLFGVLGARLWHVFTDFVLYKNNLVAIFYIQNGGLSIVGGLIGGLLGIICSGFIFSEIRTQTAQFKKKIFLQLLDVAVFGLPVAQAFGRLGNFVNQELYGLPTTGFFKIFISEEKRLLGFEKTAYYHPLFLYEMIATGLFAITLHVVYSSKNLEKKLPQIGSGKLFLFYIFYYSIVRFFLDFLRIDRKILLVELGLNQLFLLLVIIIVISYFLTKLKNEK